MNSRQTLINYYLFANLLCLLLITANCKKAKRIQTSGDVNEETCEVCVKFVGQFINNLDEKSKKDPLKIEDEFRKVCKVAKKDDNRFCYYIGGLEESATGILGEMSKPISWGAPVEKVCHKLFMKDEQVCELRYEKSVDFANVNLKKMKVADLKSILTDWGEVCRGCSEKSEFIKLIEQVMPKHAPEAWKQRQLRDDL